MKRYYYTYSSIALVTMITQFLGFKYFFPNADLINDSYNYLESAHLNLNANLWPVGYAKFINFVWLYSHYDTAILFSQFFIYHLCALYFFFTFLKKGAVNKYIRIFVFIILFLNPIVLSINNYILSDVLLTGLSLLWIAQLYRLRESNNVFLLIGHVVTLVYIFTLKYQAIFFPVVSIVFIGVIKKSWLFKTLASGSIILVLFWFILFTKREMERLYKVPVFSAFEGWQLANNALEGYTNVLLGGKRDSNKIEEELKYIDDYVICSQSYLKDIRQLELREGYLSSYYLWADSSPLQTYAGVNLVSSYHYLHGRMIMYSLLYHKYGWHLIKNYKLEFLKYYLLPNSRQFFIPQQENVGFHGFNANNDFRVAQTRSLKFFSPNNTGAGGTQLLKRINILMPIMVFVLVFLLMCRTFLYKKFLRNRFSDGIVLVVNIYFPMCFLFKTFAGPIVLRYLMFDIILGYVVSALILSEILEGLKLRKSNRDVSLDTLYGSKSFKRNNISNQ